MSEALRLGWAVTAALVLATACNGDSRAATGGSSSRAPTVPLSGDSGPVVKAVLAGVQAVRAEQAVVEGRPHDCPSDPVQWIVSLDLSECNLDIAPCPVEPVIDGPVIGEVFLESSGTYVDREGLGLPTYPGFCELRILEAEDPDAYEQCTNETGVAVVEDDVERVIGGIIETVEYCRLLKPAECPAGVRIDVDVCRVVEPRGWSCDPDYRLMNEFNKCYRPLEAFAEGSHPACGEGAPVFAAQNCADYAGADFTDAPDCVNDFPTVDPPNDDVALSSSSNAGDLSGYWCEFDPAFLNADCHGANRTPADCAPSVAMCLKRSTRTGGCDAIAHTIRCRSLEAAFLAGDLAAPEVRREGCQPCVLLPFETASSDCPGDVLAEPVRGESDEEDRVLAARGDFAVNENICAPNSDGSVSDRCLALIACADPARGRITWSSTHFSQYAVVNSPVIVSVRDIPAETRAGGITFDSASQSFKPAYDTVLPYPASAAGEFGDAMARYGKVDPHDARIDSVRELVGLYGECMFERAPQFRLRVRELWPSDPADVAAIERYFGSSSLDWWRALDPAEQADRVEPLTAEVDCNVDLPVWCRWTPTRAGYFEITGMAAWISERWDRGARAILGDAGARLTDDFLSDPVNRETLAEQMAGWGATTPALLERMAGDLGLRSDLTAVLPRENLRGDGRYTGSESRFSCGGTDVRITCAGQSSGDFGNYTETDPVGVMVHDVRVATRAPRG